MSILIILQTGYTYANNNSIEGLWITRDNLVSPQKIDALINFAEKYGFNNLFVQVRGRGDAYYFSTFVPRSSAFAKKENHFDPLKCILDHARKKNIKIHAWLNMFLLWSAPDPPDNAKHLYHSHPEWFAHPLSNSEMWLPGKERVKGVEGVYLSPGNEEVQTHLIGVVSEILREYDVDGIHMDYIRYPNNNYGYNRSVRQQFYRTYLVDPIELVNGRSRIIRTRGEREYNKLRNKWSEFRTEILSKFVKNISSAINLINSKTYISAAVKPDINTARSDNHQDWQKWISNNWIDYIMPMNYTTSDEQFVNLTNHIISIAPRSKVLMGIAAYNQDKYRLGYKYFKAKAHGVKGICFFSYNSFLDDPNLLEIVRQTKN